MQLTSSTFRSTVLRYWLVSVGAALFSARAPATAIDVVSGQPLVKSATSHLITEGVKLAKQGGTDLIAALSGDAWTWNYAFAFPREEQTNDTTLDINIPPPIGIVDTHIDPVTADATARARGFFSRRAYSHGIADLVTDTTDMSVDTNRFAVAKSVTGIGKDFETKGARAATVILTKLVKVALDPPFFPADLPGPTTLEPLPGPGDYSMPMHSMPLAPVEPSATGFDFVVGYFDPLGVETTLLDLSARLVFDAALSSWNVALTPRIITPGTTGLPSANQFACASSASGRVTCSYEATTLDTIAIPFTPASTWTDDSVFRLFSRASLFAQSTDVPEPHTAQLLLLAVALLTTTAGRRRVRFLPRNC